MNNKVKKIAILTGGGDCPGLNAVIRAVTKAAIANYGYEVIGYKFGYRGLYDNDFIKLDAQVVSGILHKGGTILYSSNKDNLFDYQVEENGQCVRKDVSDVAIENLKKEGVDVLVVLGGDGTLASARDFARKGVNVIGVPKTIDNDLSKTDVTFGFNSAVDVVVDALDKLHTTAESHHRIMILEVMGRNAGWIGLHAGIAGSADVILIPEIPFSLDAIIAKLNERSQRGLPFSIIVVAEGAMEKGGELTIQKIVSNSPDPVRLGGIGNKLALALEAKISRHEIRNTVLGHLQRGGITSAYDRLLSTRYGVAAVELIAQGKFGYMVAIQDGKMSEASLEEVTIKNKLVDVDSELIHVAKSLGISFGD
ncbi:6-phosphofructokinase [uncultured Acetobacterium sp.]|uniref:6-phosphofructokinase n=1 Tax=uncultured Acetobacterium sp. TaxID=217139 RepID=UPI0025EE0F1A|nr:6-phosphofructokinase [uncultured Acetobacterium sp.]